jgi:hypothetical protein
MAKLLEGFAEGFTAEEPAKEGLLGEWRREKQRLEEELLHVRHELEEARAENEKLKRSIRAIQKPLSGVYQGLRALFGEIEFAVGQEEVENAPRGAATQQPANQSAPRWESYKQNFPGVPAQIIDALLAHGQMKMTHLAKLIKRDYSTVKGAVRKLKDAGALVGEPGADGGVRLKL